MRRYAAIAITVITVLGLFGEASAAPKIAKGDDKYAETANPEAKNRKVSFVSKVHEPGLPLKYSTYLMNGTDAAAAPVFVMMEQNESTTPPKMETFAAEGLIPPGLVVFVMNGSLMPTVKGGFSRYMRGEAFGRPGRGFPSVLIDELIPVAARNCGVTVSNDPDMHFICGSSAGGGATLNAVWYRNDYFRRAYAASPSVDALRGGEDILRLIRMTETKPLRIFISTGDREPDRTGGDLFYDDMQLRSAFDFAGYPCELMYFPQGGHNAGVGDVDMMRRMFAFVWKDWRTTKIVPPRNPVRVASLVADGTAWAECKASVPAKRSVSAAGGVYSCDGGRIVFTKGGSSKPVAECFSRVEAISLSSDGWRLYVVDASRRDIFALTVEPDGSLGFPFQLAPIRLAHDATRLSATDLLTLENDRVLAATELGVQSSLSFGALDVVLPLPGDLPVDRIWMDGKTLYAQSGRRVFRRELLVAAARDDVITKPLSSYYAIPGENKYSGHRPQFEEAYRTLKPIVVTNRIQVAPAAAPVAAAPAVSCAAKCGAVDYIAHQGEEALAPGHSRAAYRLAVAHGLDWLKLDVHETKDGHVVLQHDATLKATMNSDERISDLTLAEIEAKGCYGTRTAYTNETITTLTDALEIAKGMRKGVWVDFKYFTPAFAQKVFARLDAAGFGSDRIMVATWNRNALRWVKENRPGVRRVAHTYIRKRDDGFHVNALASGKNGETVCATEAEVAEVLDAQGKALGLHGFNMPAPSFTRRKGGYDTTPWMIAELHRRGYWVSVWFVFNAAAGEFYRKAGADAFVTNCKANTFPHNGALTVAGATVAYRVPRTSWLGTNFCVAAAQDVARVLGKAVGREIACVTEDSLPAGAKNVIYVGDTAAARAAGLDVSAWPAQECLLRCDGERAFVAARTGMGVNNGAVEFLRRFADFYFVSFWGGDEPVARNPSLAIPKHDARVVPAIRNRSMYSGSVPDGQKAYCQRVRLQPDGFGRRMEFMRRQRLFLINAECDDLDRVSEQTHGCHSQFDYLPPEKYFKDHPEYYSMGKDGVRHGTPNRGSQLCFTNPDVLELVYRSMVGFIEADRKADPVNYPKIYDFTQMDSCRILCECPSCRAVKAKYNRVKGGYAEGGDTGLQLEFVNKLAKRIAAKYPDVVIRTFAYVSTEEIPDGIAPEKNVMIWLCDLYSYSDHERPLGEGPLNKKRGDLVEGWAKLVPNIQLWDYMLTGPQRGGSFPEVNARALASDAKLFRRCGIQRVFLEASYQGAAFWDLNAFLAGQLYFNPDADVGSLLDKYCRMYGAAAPQMRNAIDYLMARMAEAPQPTFLEWSSRNFAWRSAETFAELKRRLDPVYAAQTEPSVKARVADVLLETCRELLPALKSDEAAAAEYARVKADSLKYLGAYLPYSVLSPKEREALKDDFEGMLAMLEADFSDKPAVFNGVKRSDMVAMDYHSLDPRTRKQKVVADAKSSVGYACSWGDGTRHDTLTGGIYDTTTSEYLGRFVAKLAADEPGYTWHRMGVGRVSKSCMLYLTKSWVPNFGLGKLYRSCDGMEDVNNWEVWASVRRGEGERLLIDRVLLRRVPPGTK